MDSGMERYRERNLEMRNTMKRLMLVAAEIKQNWQNAPMTNPCRYIK